MYASNVLAVSGAFIAAVVAVPMAGERHHQHHQREIVWETAIDEVVVTVPVTKTVWIEPGETAPSEPHPHGYGPFSSAPAAEPAAYSPSSSAVPAPAYTPETSSSSVYVAPPAYTPQSSSSVYVAPPAYTPETTSSVYVAPTPTSTSVYVAPTPSSSSVYVAPTPESTYVAPTSYSAPASSAPAYSAPASSGGSSTGALTFGMAKSGTSFTGDLTYYEPGLGACGGTNSTDQPIVAISEKIFDSYSTGNSNSNPLCWKWLTITGKDGNPYKAQIVDRCPGCAEADLDLTQSLFDACTVNGDGRVHGITWTMD